MRTELLLIILLLILLGVGGGYYGYGRYGGGGLGAIILATLAAYGMIWYLRFPRQKRERSRENDL